ncbi:hypothetical protein BJ322DRAFT_1058314 [Thelephora terrestris]|uniref:F-box domain-containing protein n=1 Tax=Thelephora terrestris TaxID=56493 RepID=A0A9P6L7M9_9AGAM|nr:hypothetical protein BJ322DRAFT_1058314 [Thelephora terrestris]
MSPEASRPETDSHHIEFDPEVKWPDINQMLARKLRLDTEKLPDLPVEVWLLIFQLATEVPFAFLPRTESPFDLPPRPTHKEMTAELSRSLITKRYIALVCRSWNEIATPFLYGAVLLRSTRGVTAAWNTFCGSAESNAGVRLGHHVKRIDVSTRDSQVNHDNTGSDQDEERRRIAEILQRLPNLSIFTMHTHLRSGNATAIAEALINTSANTLQTIEWGGLTFGHVCLSGTTWAKLVSSCPNLKSLDGPACQIFSTVLHQDARLGHLSIRHDGREEGNVLPNPPTPSHLRYGSNGGWNLAHPNTRAYCSRAISLEVRFLSLEELHRLLAQCPKLSQLVLRIPSWNSMRMPCLALDPSITHLGLFVEQRQPKLSSLVEGLGCITYWKIPGVKTLRLMSRHLLLEGDNLKKKRTQKALQEIRAAGLVLENWEGKPFA